MKSVLLLFISLSVLCSCQCMRDKAHEAIIKTGKGVGKTTTEFAKGVSEGVYKSLECEVDVDESFKNLGLEIGKINIASSENATDNILSAYLIFNNDFKETVKIRVIDKNGLEYGRITQEIIGKKAEAHFVDFIFDSKTKIENNSLFIIDKPF